jgi:predicted nucleic acid-binding protein
MVTVDASIWVAAEAGGEPYHADCRAFLVATLGGGLPFHQPLLSIVEMSNHERVGKTLELLKTGLGYSARSATIGSTRAARRAGT